VIQFDAVSKTFRSAARPALDGVSFEVKQGEIFGLLGHNGAGKSTALGVMLGMVKPNSGEARIGGISVQQERVKALRHVGAIFESPRFYEYLSGMENLRILAGYSNYWDDEKAAEVIEKVQLKGAVLNPVKTYSHGMRQRLALAQALLPQPELLLLDEPTNGLDPNGIVEFRKLVRSLRDDLGITVLLNSHLLGEVEQLCDRVVILRQGQKVFEGSKADLESDHLLIHIILDDWMKAAPLIQQFGGKQVGDDRVQLSKDADPADLLTMLIQGGLKVSEFHQEKDTLEALYMRVSEGGTGA